MTLQAELSAARGGGTRGPALAVRARRPRWDLLAAWAVMALPALLIVAVVLPRQRVGDLEERLVRDANALYGRTSPRPVHVDRAAPGATGDAVGHLPPVARAAERVLAEDRGFEQVRRVVSGEAGIGALPRSVRPALAEAGPDLDAILLATRAERADFSEPFDAKGGAGAVTWQHVGTFAGVRMRLRLAAGEPGGALRDGLDGLALGRDVAIAGGLVGRMVGAAIVTRLAPPTAAAVDALPGPAERRDAVRRLRAIRDALPPFSRTIAEEAVYSQLLMGEAIPARARARLGPRAQALIAREGMTPSSWWQEFVVRDGWRDLRAAQDQVIAAADLPEAERTAAWEAVEARVQRLANPYAAIALIDHGRYARRADAMVRRLDALVLAAAAGAFRDVHGRWPASAAELSSAGELQPREAARLAGAALAAHPGDDGLEVVVPLPRADEKEPGELRLPLHGRGGAED